MDASDLDAANLDVTDRRLLDEFQRGFPLVPQPFSVVAERLGGTPADILARNGVTRDDIVRGRGGPGVLYTLKELREIARNHLKKLAGLGETIPPALKPAFLPVALVEPYLRRMERRGYDPYRTIITLPAWRRQWILWRASRSR